MGGLSELIGAPARETGKCNRSADLFVRSAAFCARRPLPVHATIPLGTAFRIVRSHVNYPRTSWMTIAHRAADREKRIEWHMSNGKGEMR